MNHLTGVFIASPHQNSVGSNNQQETEENEAEFHPISCNNCKRLHKSCDRRLPTCEGCKWRKVDCVYQEAKKGSSRIRKKKSANDGKITFRMENGIVGNCSNSLSINNALLNNSATITGTTNTIGTLNNQLINEYADMRKYIDLYEQMLNEICVISPSELETYLLAKDDSLPNCKEVKAMFLAIRAHIEQCMCLPTADVSAKKARDTLSQIFDEHSNFYVACAYAYLACYEIGCGKLKTGRFYLKFVEFYFEENPIDDSKATIYQINLKKFKHVLTTEAKSENTVMGSLRDWHEIAEKHLRITFPKEWNLMLEQPLTENNYVIFIKMMECVMDMGKNIMKDRKATIPFNDIAGLVGNGLKIRILTEMNRGKDKIEESAFKITSFTESDEFLFAPSFVIASVAAACKVHLQIIKLIEKGERKNCDEGSPIGPVDYYQILSKDLRALNLLSKRFKGVQLFHQNMIKEIETIIERKHFYTALNECISNPNSTSIYSPGVDLSKIGSAFEFLQFIAEIEDKEDENTREQRKKEYEHDLSTFLDSFSPGTSVESADLEPFLDSAEISELFNMNYELTFK